MPFQNEHAARIREPDYAEYRRSSVNFPKGIVGIFGIRDGKTELQSIRFRRTEFDADEAKAWLKEHGFEPIKFEAAVRKADEATNFPSKGDDLKVSLRNSKYPVFPRAEAERIKENHPDAWKKGGNIRGNEAFELWGKASAGEMTEGVEAWIREREAWAARHLKDFRPAGVIAQIKWGVIGSRGIDHMRAVVRDMTSVEKSDVWKAMDEDLRLVTGVVLEPDVVDGQGDILDAETIRKAAHEFMEKSRVVGDSHESVADAVVVESWIAPDDTEIEGSTVRKGTWLMTCRVSDTLWEAVKSGAYTGFSIGGSGVREPVE